MIRIIEKLPMYKTDASITVFLTLVFGIILAVVTAAFENVRFLTVDAYMYSAAETAAMSVFGDYNRELYQEYGLFGYGGYAGNNMTELSEALSKAIAANLQTAPDGQSADYGSSTGKKSGEYTSLYRIGSVETDIRETENVTDEAVFYEQIEAYLATQIVVDVGDKIKETYQDMVDTDRDQSLQESLDMTSEYEQGNYDVPVAGEDHAEQDKSNSQNVEEASAAEVSPMPDHAGGNPLETFRELLRDGALNLVCDANSLSQESIYSAYSEQKQESSSSSDEGKETGAADLLKKILAGNETILAGNALQTSGKHSKLIRYAQHVFPNYRNSGKQHFRYGLEYLVSGSEQERDNLQGMINRLLLIRTALNFAYVHSNAALQAESLATATKIAGALGLPVLITAIQQTILLILSVEESCVDITALLDGKSVPVMKNASNFKINYSEICSVNRTVFQTKASSYPDSGQAWRNGVLDYQQYLWLFMMMASENSLRLRIYDLIQDDLQVRFNATFSLEQCISGMPYQISCQMPFLWSGLIPGNQKDSIIGRSISGYYHYQS